jgi:hypothetical protein
MTDTDVREYAAQAVSTDTFGRVLCSARNHHLVVDGPVQNGCPGEAINPAELFLSGVAACGVELVQVLAKAQAVPLHGIAADIRGTIDRSRPVTLGCFPVQLRAPEFPHERCYRTAATGRGFQGQVTTLRHGRSCDPGCTDRTCH